MRIALMHNSVLPPKNYGGIERIVVALAYEFKKLGHQVVVCCKDGSGLDDFEVVELPENYKQVPVETWLPPNIDFLHAHEPLPIEPKLPYLVTIHGNGHRNEKYWANTNFLSESHCRNHNGNVFIYNGIDPDRYPFEDAKDDYFVFLARASWRVKNLRTAISLANDVGVRLKVMGGTGTDSKYVKYHGMIGEAEGKLRILSKARALIYPTNWDEPCAVAPLESLACGTPVISSANGCMPELVRPGTGFAVRTYDELVESVRRLPEIEPRSCRASVETHFSVWRMAQEYISLFERITREGHLAQTPGYNFSKSSVELLYKPTLANRMRRLFTGKV